MPTSANEQLIHAYLEIAATDDYENFGTLLTDDCTFSLMPSGHIFKGRKAIMAFTELAGNSRTHDNQGNTAMVGFFAAISAGIALALAGVVYAVDGVAFKQQARTGFNACTVKCSP